MQSPAERDGHGKPPARYALVLLASALLLMPRPAQAGGTIASCGKVISAPGSYTLNKNLTVKTGGGDCITIDASNVTLDLAGYNINCGSTTAIGIVTASGTSAITIRDGIVVNCNDGIRTADSTGVLIDRIIALSNAGSGIYVGINSSVMHSIADFNGFAGILVRCPSNVSYNTAILNNTPSGTSKIFDIDPTDASCNIVANSVDP